MKTCPFVGRSDINAKTIGHQLQALAEAIASNKGAVPDGWSKALEGLGLTLARLWDAGDGKVFRAIGALAERSKATGEPPGDWEHKPTKYARKVLFAKQTKRFMDTPDGRVSVIFPFDTDATAEDVWRAAKSDGVNFSPLDARRAFKDVRQKLGFPVRGTAGRPKGSRTRSGNSTPK